MLSILSKFQNEIIATIAILTLIIIYILFKREKTSKPTSKQDNQQDDNKKTTEETVPEKTENKKENIQNSDTQNINYDDLSGTQEGDFGNPQEPIKKSKGSKKRIYKRDPIQHEKITKQNFSEFSGNKILIAEDNLINQKVILGLLAGSGIDIVVANDGKEALNILEKDANFLLILMDAHMPRIDGFEATRIIRNDRKYDHIPVIALSGDTALDDIKKMTEAGMDEHLEKPLRMDALYDIFYSYTGDDNSQEYIEVVMTKELNGDKGLTICGGDEHFYREILNEFIKDYENSAQTLRDLLHHEKFKEADKLLLDIIGITANIGAQHLNSIANDIKSALKDTEEKSHLMLINQYTAHLDILIKDIQEYL